MSYPANIIQVVPNTDCEVFDPHAVSEGENYFPADPDGDISNPVETNWITYAGDTSQKLIAYNLKTLQFLWEGAPLDITKVARNVSPIKGPIERNNVQSGDFDYKWFSWNSGASTKFRRDDASQTLDLATIFPAYASFFGQWKSRFTAYFDAAGAPTVAGETSISEITLWKSQIGTRTFTGFSPIFVSSTEFLQKELLVFGDNVVYYMKDVASATRKQDRRGTRIYCRIERDNYATEYQVCDLPFQAKFLEFGYFAKPYQFLIIRGPDCSRYTLQSAPYNPVIVEEITAVSAALTEVDYHLVIFTQPIEDSVESGTSLISISYDYIRKIYDFAEGVSVGAAFTTLAYLQSVKTSDAGDEDVAQSSQLLALSYVYDPPVPPVPPTPETAPTDKMTGTFTIQSVTYA